MSKKKQAVEKKRDGDSCSAWRREVNLKEKARKRGRWRKKAGGGGGPKTQQGVAGYGSSDGEGHNVSNQKAWRRHN